MSVSKSQSKHKEFHKKKRDDIRRRSPKDTKSKRRSLAIPKDTCHKRIKNCEDDKSKLKVEEEKE